MKSRDPLLDKVREILLRDWDPMGVGHLEDCSTEYDRYALTIVKQLRSGVDEFKLSAMLAGFERNSMGLSRTNEERQQRVARLLLGAVSSASSR